MHPCGITLGRDQSPQFRGCHSSAAGEGTQQGTVANPRPDLRSSDACCSGWKEKKNLTLPQFCYLDLQRLSEFGLLRSSPLLITLKQIKSKASNEGPVCCTVTADPKQLFPTSSSSPGNRWQIEFLGMSDPGAACAGGSGWWDPRGSPFPSRGAPGCSGWRRLWRV